MKGFSVFTEGRSPSLMNKNRNIKKMFLNKNNFADFFLVIYWGEKSFPLLTKKEISRKLKKKTILQTLDTSTNLFWSQTFWNLQLNDPEIVLHYQNLDQQIKSIK